MSKFIDIDSREWCDLVFEGKNKRYGAYRLRQSSSKRHLYALAVVLILMILIMLTPQVIGVVEELTRKPDLGPIEEVVELSNLPIEEQVPQENIIRQESAPPPPPLKSSIQFVPPVIAADDEVTDEDVMRTQDEVQASDLMISVADVKGTDEEHGIDIAELQQHKVIVEAEPEEEKPFEVVEQNPEFPGGIAELNKFLSDNIRYPVIAQENGIQGRVIIRFVVSRTGDISNVEVLRGVDPSLDREAVRVVESMPRWIPGRQRGRAVPVYFTLPVHFRLQN
ncbi:MAG: TonB family protein [Bacteroidota bacterium]|jgi:protein TonB|nr:TonB family protein [Bacteroidota bacterium]HHU95913.1 energy transducer TonB [Petrimonas sp.]